VFQARSFLREFFSIGLLSFQSDFLTRVNQAIDDGFGDHRILKQFEPPLGLDLGSDDDGSLVVALFEDVHQRGGLFVSVVSKSQVVEDQDLGLDETSNVVEITASGLGGLDFLEQEIDRQELCGWPSWQSLFPRAMAR